MDMWHNVVVTDDAGAETTHNQPLQYIKVISITWLKCCLIYILIENSKGELSIEELNNIRKKDFNHFRCSYSEMPKLTLFKPIHPPFLVASSPATKYKKIAKDERTEPPIIEDVSCGDKTDLEPTRPVSTVHVQEVIDPQPMSGILVEEEPLVNMQKMVMSRLDPSTAVIDGISLVEKFDRKDKTLGYWRQSQVEVHSMESGISQSKTSSDSVSKIVTTDDLAPDIGMQGMVESAARGATDNEADTTGCEEDEEQNFLTCVTRSDAPGMVEPSISLVKAEVPFKHPTSPQDLDTSVPYGQSIK